MKFHFEVIGTQEDLKAVRDAFDLLFYKCLGVVVTGDVYQIFLFPFLVCCGILLPVLLELSVAI